MFASNGEVASKRGREAVAGGLTADASALHKKDIILPSTSFCRYQIHPPVLVPIIFDSDLNREGWHRGLDVTFWYHLS